MNLIYKDEELTLNFTTKNYTALKTALKAANLRTAMLEAASKLDYDVLATAIKQFADKGKLKSNDDAYEVIDNAADKQTLFFEFISELGEHGFFDKATPEQLKEEAAMPFDMNEMIQRVAPEAVKEKVKDYM